MFRVRFLVYIRSKQCFSIPIINTDTNRWITSNKIILSSISPSLMAISPTFLPILSLLMLLATYTMNANGCYTSIISFGDSLADTGNLKQLTTRSNSRPPHFMFPPYGETYFHKATGRCSNGRLIIDFIGIYLHTFIFFSSYSVFINTKLVKQLKFVKINKNIWFVYIFDPFINLICILIYIETSWLIHVNVYICIYIWYVRSLLFPWSKLFLNICY